MDNLTCLINTEIKKQYKSIRQFALFTGISQATISSALKNGIRYTNFGTVLKICKTLGICDEKIQLSVSDLNTLDNILSKLPFLDAAGRENVVSILEYCANKQLTNCK